MILHIMTLEKFTPLFIKFVRKHFAAEDHRFCFITSERYEYGLERQDEPEFLYKDEDFVSLCNYMKQAEKIILHSLKRDKVHRILRANPELLAKCIWVMWGGDFYYPEIYNEDHLFVIKNVPYMVNVLDEEIEMVRKLYGAKGKHIRSFFYNTTIFHNSSCENSGAHTEILLGHSAVLENNHLFYLDKLAEFSDEKFIVKCPLVYPKSLAEYRERVIKRGFEHFGDNFRPLTDLMPLHSYLRWIESVNFAIFPSSRQHGMGNLVNLLGSGKTVFLDTNVSTWSFFNRIGIKLFPVDKLSLSPLETGHAADNKKIVKSYFSEFRLQRDLAAIFNMQIGEDLNLEI